MDRYRQEIEETTDGGYWTYCMKIFETMVNFAITKTKTSQYELEGFFPHAYYLHENKKLFFPTYNNKYNLFYKKTFDSLDILLSEYNTLVQQCKSRDKFKEFQEKFILDQDDDVHPILQDCEICVAGFADQFCHQCGFCLCQFCLYRCRKSNDFLCPQCNIKYIYEDEEP